MVEPGCRIACTARLNAWSRASNPPCIASTRPVAGSSTTKPPDTRGTERSAKSLPEGATAMMSPGLSVPKAGVAVPRLGVCAAQRGNRPVAPLAKPSRHASPSRATTIPARQS